MLSTTGGTDYVTVSMTLSFTQMNIEQPLCVFINSIDDNIFEDDEMFSVSLSSQDPAVVIGSSSPMSLTIVDDDTGINIVLLY